jgi:1-acyl-sn-glycerol-3-phosphate acyltransferase
MRATLQLLGYYLSLVFFGSGGLLLTVFCFLTGWLPETDRTVRFFQRLIHRLFAVFVWWGAFIRLMYVRHHGFAAMPAGGCVVAANHPGLMDVTFLLARIPEALCVFKPSIRRNPVLGAAARRAGYIAGDGGHDLIRHAAEALAAGNKLIIFPEGTRTPLSGEIGVCRPGFVVAARRGGVPVQLVRIAWNSNVLVKGRAWWRLPNLPCRVDVSLGPCLRIAPESDAAAVAAEIRSWYAADPATAACHRWSAAVTVVAIPP